MLCNLEKNHPDSPGGSIPRKWKFERWGRSRWFAWWYFSIAAGFLLLAIYFYLRGGSLLLAGLRLVICLAFAVLGYLQLKVLSMREGDRKDPPPPAE